MLVEKLLHEGLSPPFLSLEITEKVRIGYVGLVGRIVKSLVKDLLEFADEVPASSHQLRQTEDVVRNIECVVPCTSFMEARNSFEVLTLPRIERFEEGTFFLQRTEGAEVRTVVVAVLKRLHAEPFGILIMAEVGGEERKRMVSDVIFKGMGDGIVS